MMTIKKIKTEQLRPGIFVSDLNCGWMENPFWAPTILIKDERMIEKIRKAGIFEVFIDTTKGLDIADAPTVAEVQEQTRQQVFDSVGQGEGVEIHTTIREEIAAASKVRKEAKKLIANVMNDVRMGKQVETAQVENVVHDMVESVFRNHNALVSLSRIKRKDQYTYVHSVNVCALMASFCKAMNMSKSTAKKVAIGALLHDIGKMMVNDDVLNKPGKLTDSEFGQMKMHASHSKSLLESTPGIPDEAVTVAGQHHERYDGAGYPFGLKGEEISIYGQMAAIVDVYDAITSDRCYHKGVEAAEALRKIYQWSDKHFNKPLVEQYIRCVGLYPAGTLVRMASDHLAVVVEPGSASLLKPVVDYIYNVKAKRFIDNRRVDLSLAENSTADRIIDFEKPEIWGINPLNFIEYLQ